MKTHNIPHQFELIQRVTVATLNIMLTILHHICEWDLDGLKDFEERYTKMARLARAKDKNTLAGIKETRERTDIHIEINNDMPETAQNRLVEETWRQCFFVALTVLKLNNSKKSLLNITDLFSEYMDALAAENRDERQQAAVDLMNETMRIMGRKEV